MQTLVLRVGALDANSGDHELELLQLDDPSAGTLVRLASDRMPPLPTAADGVNTFTADQMIEHFTRALGPDAALEPIGDQLYNCLARGAIGAQLALFTAVGAPTTTRLALVIEDAALGRLPWELLRHNRRLLLIQAAIYRATLDPAQPRLRPLPSHSWPLRMLVVVAVDAPVEGVKPVVDAISEIDMVSDALAPHDADVDLRVVERLSRQQIKDKIVDFKPHILHFIGHGGIEQTESGAGRPYLQLSLGAGAAKQLWYRDDIVTDFAVAADDPDSLRLVVLNACRTGTPSAENRDPWSLGTAFNAAGVPAVISMNSDVVDDRAALFAAGLYAALVERDADGIGKPLEQAMSAARDRVRQSRNDGSRMREWAAPCLLVSHEPGSVIRVGISQTITPDHRQQVSDTKELDQVRRMVGRRDDRYRAWGSFQQSQRKIQALIGPEEAGKTTFAHMIMERCVLCGHQLHYVNMKQIGRQGGKPDFLDLLLTLRCGDNASLLSAALPPQNFVEFHQTLDKWLGRPVDPCNRFGIPALDPAHLDSGNTEFNQLFATFRTGLERTSRAAPPLVLVIDHLDVENNDFTILHNNLFRHYLGSSEIAILLLFKDGQEKPNGYNLEGRKNVYNIIPIASFARSVWPALAMEYVRRNLDLILTPGQDVPAALASIRGIVDGIARSPLLSDPWKPIKLKALF
jgi:CHAT domain